MTAAATRDSGTIPADVTPDAALEVARSAFAAGLVHSTLRQTGWTVHNADAAGGACTVGLAGIFGPGFVADVVVRVRQAGPEELGGHR